MTILPLFTFDYSSRSPLSTFNFSLSTILPVSHTCHAGLEPASMDPEACLVLFGTDPSTRKTSVGMTGGVFPFPLSTFDL